MSRPQVSVVVPFRGGGPEAVRLGDALARLDTAGGDELLVADNTDDGLAGDLLGPGARVVRATGERSSYHARNTAARAAGNDWILFLDADCEPVGDLLERYFADPVPDDCGILAGAIVGVEDQDSLLARYTRDRAFYDGERGLGANGTLEGGAAPTGNLMIRRAVFEAVGGFAEGIRSAGDFDLCWRVQAAGWRLLRRPEAMVAHVHRDDWPSFLAMVARYGSGASWINRRYPGSSPRWALLPGLAGSARDVGVNLLYGRPTEALYRFVDAIGLVAYTVGYARSNEVS
jgi:GT2 family glycosyltransferase